VNAAPSHRASLNLKKVRTTCRVCQRVVCMEHLLLTCKTCGGGELVFDPNLSIPQQQRPQGLLQPAQPVRLEQPSQLLLQPSSLQNQYLMASPPVLVMPRPVLFTPRPVLVKPPARRSIFGRVGTPSTELKISAVIPDSFESGSPMMSQPQQPCPPLGQPQLSSLADPHPVKIRNSHLFDNAQGNMRRYLLTMFYFI
jgi:hypothetical protein